MRAFKNPRAGRAQALERLEKVALEHFVARGYAAATMDEVAAGAGMSKATVYSWFPGKAAVYSHVVAVQHQRHLATINSPVAPASCAVQALRDVAMRIVSVAHDPGFVGLCRLAAESAQHRPSQARLAVTAVLGEARHRLECALRRVGQVQAVQELDAGASASLMLGLLLDRQFEAAVVGLEGASNDSLLELSGSAVAFILKASGRV